MKHSGIEFSTLSHVEKCLKYLRYDVTNCKRGIEIYCLLYNQVYITVFTEPAISLCVTLDVCRSYHNITEV